MAVKHTPIDVVHQGDKGGHTGCGVDTKKNTGHWVSSHQKIKALQKKHVWEYFKNEGLCPENLLFKILMSLEKMAMRTWTDSRSDSSYMGRSTII